MQYGVWAVQSIPELPQHIHPPQSFFAERFFALFDVDGSGTISLGELHGALRLLLHGTAADKLRFLFQVYDVDGERVAQCIQP